MKSDAQKVTDEKWIDALAPYWGGGIVPFWQKDGEVDAQKTVDHMMQSRGQHKIGPKGEDLPFDE